MSFGLSTARPRRQPGLTAMIDVVFLLLVFFMLAASFETETAIPVGASGKGAALGSDAPRLVDVGAEDVRLNGVPVSFDALGAAVLDLVADPRDVVVLRGRDGATVQRMVDVMEALAATGLGTLVLAE